ncbi:MAG: hypothetical protein QOI11_1462 [Candidatus Eremiobacteraeota bacterium]|nr:hypothetical protein [Candidatus Eremiobacteraeota bacterium]
MRGPIRNHRRYVRCNDSDWRIVQSISYDISFHKNMWVGL